MASSPVQYTIYRTTNNSIEVPASWITDAGLDVDQDPEPIFKFENLSRDNLRPVQGALTGHYKITWPMAGLVAVEEDPSSPKFTADLLDICPTIPADQIIHHDQVLIWSDERRGFDECLRCSIHFSLPNNSIYELTMATQEMQPYLPFGAVIELITEDYCYLPTTPAVFPAACPLDDEFIMTPPSNFTIGSPEFTPQSPSYLPTSPSYSPTSPCYDPEPEPLILTPAAKRSRDDGGMEPSFQPTPDNLKLIKLEGRMRNCSEGTEGETDIPAVVNNSWRHPCWKVNIEAMAEISDDSDDESI